jgi:hypothetical protein
MVESQYQYSSVNMQDYEGLEVVPQHSDLEHYKPVERTSSLTRPEVVEYSSPPLALDPASEDDPKSKVETHYASVTNDDPHARDARPQGQPTRKYCGLAKRTCIIVAVVIGAVIAIALGVGLGVTLGNRSKAQSSTSSTTSSGDQSSNSNSNSNGTTAASSYTARSKSGFAVVKAGDTTGNAYAYYQGQKGAIRELSWQNSQWVAESSGSDIVVAAANVLDSTPITAATYPDPAGLLVSFHSRHPRIPGHNIDPKV